MLMKHKILAFNTLRARLSMQINYINYDKF
jgi:hypothetical protein